MLPALYAGNYSLGGERVLDHVWYIMANDQRLWEQGMIDRHMLTATGKMEVFFHHARRGENNGEYYVLEVMPWCQLGLLFKQLQNTLACLFVNTWSQYTGGMFYCPECHMTCTGLGGALPWLSLSTAASSVREGTSGELVGGVPQVRGNPLVYRDGY